MCQSNIPWECVLDLLENGARICLANHRGIRAVDLTSKPILQRLQSHIVDSCWLTVSNPILPPPQQGNILSVFSRYFVADVRLIGQIFAQLYRTSNYIRNRLKRYRQTLVNRWKKQRAALREASRQPVR